MMKKRLISLALAGALFLSCLSLPVLAAEGEAAEALPPVPVSEAEPAPVEGEHHPEIMPLEQPDAVPAEEAETPAEEVQTPAGEAQAPAEEIQTPAEEPLPAGETESAAGEAAEEDGQLFYLALGDSITAGVGLSDLAFLPAPIGFDMTPNFTGYSADCYVAEVAEKLGLDRDHAINFGLPGLMTKDLADLVRTGAMPEMNQPSGTFYVYPEIQEYIKKADVISIQIGANDALVPFIVSLGNATNWKSETLANSMLSGMLRDFSFESLSLFIEGVKKLTLTSQERKDLFYALGDGMKLTCEQGYATVVLYLPQVVQAIRELSPDAQILLIGYNNPVPLLATWSKHFNRLNSYAKQLAKDMDLTYVSIPWTSCANDGHPTISGHRYIARKIVKAMD